MNKSLPNISQLLLYNRRSTLAVLKSKAFQSNETVSHEFNLPKHILDQNRDSVKGYTNMIPQFVWNLFSTETRSSNSSKFKNIRKEEFDKEVYLIVTKLWKNIELSDNIGNKTVFNRPISKLFQTITQLYC